MATPCNWSQITAPIQPIPHTTQKSKPRCPPQPQSQPSNNRTRNRKNRKKRQKNAKQQWPALNNQNHNNNAPPHTHSNGSVSYSTLTSKTQKFAPPSNPYDALSTSSASSFHTNNTKQNNITSINKQQLHKREQQRRSALNTLKQQWMNHSKDINSDILSKTTIYGVRNRGICNRNVDCYINAIIQSLMSLPLLLSIFSSIKYAKTPINIGPFTKALYDTIHLFSIKSRNASSNTKGKQRRDNATQKQMDAINYNHTNYSSINHPKSLIFILDKFRRSMGNMGNAQQDAQEFLGYIIANLHDEMTWDKHTNKNGTASVSTCSIETHGNTLMKRQNTEQEIKNENNDDDDGWKLVSKNIHDKASIAHKLKINESLISQLFGGEYYQMIRYQGKEKGKRNNKKGKPSVSYQPFFTISLDINDHKIKSVTSALQNHLSKPHMIEYKKGFGNKCELISESPYYLILHLKRFLFEDGEIYKLNKYIAYDTKLMVAPHLLFDKNTMKVTGNMNKLRYELRSVLVHEGDFVTHGHYLSFCRREDFYMNKRNKNRTHQWIMFDDDKVKGSIDVNTIKKQQAYVLLYQKIV